MKYFTVVAFSTVAHRNREYLLERHRHQQLVIRSRKLFRFLNLAVNQPPLISVPFSKTHRLRCAVAALGFRSAFHFPRQFARDFRDGWLFRKTRENGGVYRCLECQSERRSRQGADLRGRPPVHQPGLHRRRSLWNGRVSLHSIVIASRRSCFCSRAALFDLRGFKRDYQTEVHFFNQLFAIYNRCRWLLPFKSSFCACLGFEVRFQITLNGSRSAGTSI